MINTIKEYAKRYYIPYAIIGFMLGRLDLFGIFNPIIIGYISVFCYQKGFFSVAIASVLGILTISPDMDVSRYIIAVFILGAMHIYDKEKYKPEQVASIAMLGGGLLFAIISEFSFYYVMLAILEAVLAFCVNVVLKVNVGALNILDTSANRAESYPRELERIAATRLKNISAVFNRIGDSYKEAVGVEGYNVVEEKQRILDSVTENSCSKCPMLEQCWHTNCNQTYTTFYNAIDRWIKNGEVCKMPESFRQTCGYADEIVLNAKGIIDLNLNNRAWQDKISSVKYLVSQQMKSAGNAIEELYRDMEKQQIDLKLSNTIYKGLTSALAKSVAAVKKDESTEIYLTLDSCHNCNVCNELIIPRLKDITGKDFIKRDVNCIINTNDCLLHLIEEPPIRISVAAATKQKDGSEITGDSYTQLNLRGKSIIALADGMGSGEIAREESAASIELYEDFVSAGFDCETILDIINSVLLMKEDRESFSTLDICTIDLYSGKADFVKIGAVSTLIVNDKGVDIIKASTLPVGILGTLDTDFQERYLEKGDIIVMLTDGILDSTGNIVRNESWIVDLVENRKDNNPSKLATSILNRAVENSQGMIRDDMTVLVTTLY